MSLTLDPLPEMPVSSENSRHSEPHRNSYSQPATTHSLERAFGSLSISSNESGQPPVTVDASTSTDPISARRFACRYGAPLAVMERRDERPAGNLHPSAVDCKWWKQGYCARGASCYFRHDPNVAGLEVKRRARGHQQRGFEGTSRATSNQQSEDTGHTPGIGAFPHSPA
jgi:hypothetical protein